MPTPAKKCRYCNGRGWIYVKCPHPDPAVRAVVSCARCKKGRDRRKRIKELEERIRKEGE